MRPFTITSGGATLVGDWRGDDSARPLILVHGFGGSRHDWNHVRDRLPPSILTIAYDQRGFGDSSALEGETYSHSDDLLALLDDLGIAQADLCGMSLGGATVLNFALNHPDRVRRLILVSPLIVAWSWSSDWIDRWKAIGRTARAGEMDAARELWWQHPLFDEVRKTSHSSEMRQSIEAFSGRQWVSDPQREELPDVDRLHQLRSPTLLLTGALDLPDFRLIGELIEAAVPDITRIDYPDAGHMLNYEKPDEIAAEIARFLPVGQNL